MIRFFLLLISGLVIVSASAPAQNIFINPNQKSAEPQKESPKSSIFITPGAQKTPAKPFVPSTKMIVQPPSVVFKPFEFDLKNNPQLVNFNPEEVAAMGLDPREELRQIFETAERRKANLEALNKIQERNAKEFAAREAARLREVYAAQNVKAVPANTKTFQSQKPVLKTPPKVFQDYR